MSEKLVRHKWHTWYVEPLDGGRTNKVISDNLESSGELTSFGRKCADGKTHDLWECPKYRFVANMIKNRKEWGLSFIIWHQEGNGQIRVWNFPQKKAKKARSP